MKQQNDSQFQTQDDIIRKAFSNDKYSNQIIFDDFNAYLKGSKLKVKKFSSTQRILIKVLVLLILLTIAIVAIINALGGLPQKSKNPTENNLASSTNNQLISNIDKASQKKNTISNNTVNKSNINNNIENTNTLNKTNNNTSNTENNANTTNSSSNISNTTNANTDNTTNSIYSISNVTKSEVTDYTDQVDLDELTKFIEECSVGIERLNLTQENLESNTILLLIAKQYFDSNSNNATLDINTNLAATKPNMHKYLSELTGKKYPNNSYIQSFNNYIGYTSTSDSYKYGADIGILRDETYSVSDVKITNEFDDVFTSTANVTRKLNGEKTKYQVTIVFELNEDYTYQQFCLKSIKAKNMSVYPDNTTHLIDVAPQPEDDD